MPASSLEQIVSLAKRRGFVFPSSSVYGGLASTWDYGPLGVELHKEPKTHRDGSRSIYFFGPESLLLQIIHHGPMI